MGGKALAFGILPKWIRIWLICSTLICSMDVAFTILRPESLPGGKYDKYFLLWNVYARVDTRYANATDPMTRVTGPLMCVELVLNLIALFLDFVSSVHSLVAAFASSTLVFWKTAIYLGLFLVPNEAASRNVSSHISYCGIAPQTPFWKELLLFWAPNSVWLFVPLIAVLHLWGKIARGLIRPMPRALTTFSVVNCRKTLQKGRRDKKTYKSANEMRELCASDELDPTAADKMAKIWTLGKKCSPDQ